MNEQNTRFKTEANNIRLFWKLFDRQHSLINSGKLNNLEQAICIEVNLLVLLLFLYFLY